MAKDFEYRVTAKTIGGAEHEQKRAGGWDHANAVAWAQMSAMPAGATIKIERRTVAAGGLRDGKRGPWLPHRAYVVGSDGIARRTDRPQRPACRSCGSFPAITARGDGLCQDCGKAHDGGEPTASAYRG